MRGFKKLFLFFVILSVMFSCCALGEKIAVNNYPDGYSAENLAKREGFPAKKRAYYFVIDNSMPSEGLKNTSVALARIASIAENSTIKVYSMYQNTPDFNLIPEKTSVDNMYKLFNEPSKEAEVPGLLPVVVNDVNALGEDFEKNIIILGQKGTSSAYINKEELENIANANPEVMFFTADMYNKSGNYSVDSLFFAKDNSKNLKNLYDDYNLQKYFTESFGYIEVPSIHYSYNKSEGLLTIEEGKADANIFIYAKAQKNDLLYIGGYLTTAENYEKYKNKSKIKGVSLAYNYVNTTNALNPKNTAFCLFSIDNEQIDIVKNAFVIPVKNADFVELYYRGDIGYGLCGTEVSYNKGYDDKIENTNATETTQTSGQPKSLFDTDNGFGKVTEQSPVQKVFSVIGTVLSTFFNLLFYILILFIIIMIAVPKVRNTAYAMILKTKIGPLAEKIVGSVIEKYSKFSSTTAYYSKKIKGTVKEGERYVFISYSSKDTAVPNNRIDEIVRRLENLGINCWISKNSIPPGKKYSDVIPSAIENCTLFMIFISPNSIASKEVEKEFLLASDYDRDIIPVQIKDFEVKMASNDWTYNLRLYQLAKVFSNSGEKMEELIECVKGYFKKTKQETVNK